MDTESHRPSQPEHEYQEAKLRWETFETHDSRFPYPRKNNEYVRRLALSDGSSPASIARALQYYDSHELWLLRAEGYLGLAGSLNETEGAEVATKLYQFSAALLAEDLPRHSDPDKYDDPISQNGTRTLDNVILILNKAAVLTRNEVLMDQHQTYLENSFRDRMVTTGDADRQESSLTSATVLLEDFKAQRNPNAYCAARRTREEIAAAGGFLSCKACHVTYGVYEGIAEPQRISAHPCMLEP